MASQYQSNGVTSLATSSDAAVTALTAAQVGRGTRHHFLIKNNGAADVFYSLDGSAADAPWVRVKGGDFDALDGLHLNGAIYIKRVAGGSNAKDVEVFIW